MPSRILGKEGAFPLLSRCCCIQTSVDVAANYSVVCMCCLTRHVQLPSSGHIISLKEIVHTCVFVLKRFCMCVCCYMAHIITPSRKLRGFLRELIDGIITDISKQRKI